MLDVGACCCCRRRCCAQVNTWFAERADLILLLFDAHKLDISDEFRAVIEKLRGQVRAMPSSVLGQASFCADGEMAAYRQYGLVSTFW
jgi:hypothetical protein